MDDTSFKKISDALGSAPLNDPRTIKICNQSFLGPKPLYRGITAPINECVYVPLNSVIKVHIKNFSTMSDCEFEMSPYDSVGALKRLIYEKMGISPLKQKLVIGSRIMGNFDILAEYTNDDSMDIIVTETSSAKKDKFRVEQSTTDAGLDKEEKNEQAPIDKSLLLEEVRSAISLRVKDQKLVDELYNSFCEISQKLLP